MNLSYYADHVCLFGYFCIVCVSLCYWMKHNSQQNWWVSHHKAAFAACWNQTEPIVWFRFRPRFWIRGSKRWNSFLLVCFRSFSSLTIKHNDTYIWSWFALWTLCVWRFFTADKVVGWTNATECAVLSETVLPFIYSSYEAVFLYLYETSENSLCPQLDLCLGVIVCLCKRFPCGTWQCWLLLDKHTCV